MELDDPTAGLLFSVAARFYIGQNIHTFMTTASPNGLQDWQSAVKAWYDEVKDFSKNNINPFQ
jgi:hypothetical protein